MNIQKLQETDKFEGTIRPIDITQDAQNLANFVCQAAQEEGKPVVVKMGAVHVEGVKKAIRKTQINIEEPQRQWIELIKEKDELPRKKRKEAWYEKFRW